jgi:hypothetical protein
MSVTVPLNTGKARAAGVSSLAVSFGSLPTAGDSIIVCAGSEDDITLGLSSGKITDNQSGSYTLDRSDEGFYYPRYDAAGVWSDLNIAAPSGTFTITYTVSNGGDNQADCLIGAIAVQSLATSGALDQVQSANGTGQTAATGSTGATAQNDEIAVACCTIRNTVTNTLTPPSGFTEIYNEGDAGYTDGGAAYKILTATGAQSASWTMAGAGVTGWAAVIGTYKGLGTPWEPQTDAPEKIINIATPRWRS